MPTRQSSTLQRASDALGAYLQLALAPDVSVNSNWPEPDSKLKKSVTITSIGPRRVEIDANQMQQYLVKTDPVSPPDPIQRLYTWSLAAFRQDAQLDVWATSFAACDDVVARLDRALRAGLGATIGQSNADPFRDGCLVALDPTTGPPGFADFVFDGQDDDQTPAQVGRDEWRAMFRGECAVNYVVQAQTARLAAVKLSLKISESGEVGPSTYAARDPAGLIITTP